MCSFQPIVPTFHGTKQTYIPKNLASCGYVYVRNDDQRKPLHQPYDGPYRIFDTADKYFTLDLHVNGKHQNISVDRLKDHSPVINTLKNSIFHF